jgi:hypothetical protein
MSSYLNVALDALEKSGHVCMYLVVKNVVYIYTEVTGMVLCGMGGARIVTRTVCQVT